MENIIVTKFGKSYEEFVQNLPKNDCRYATINFHFKKDGKDLSKLIFINWAPDTAKIKKKLTFKASKSLLLEEFKNIDLEIQASELEQVDQEYLTKLF